MSAFLANRKTYNYIASGLYDAATRYDSDHHYAVCSFLGIDRDTTPETLEQVINELVCQLYDLNRLALVTRYGEGWDRDNVSPLEIKRSVAINPVQFIKCIGCVLYQCCEYLTDETETYKKWTALEHRLALSLLMKTPEYDAAQWDLAA